MSLKNSILKLLAELLTQEPYGLHQEQLTLEEPNNPEFGDYATNVALQLPKKLKKAPPLIAQELVTKLNQSQNDFVFSEKNGFINIRIADHLLFTAAAKMTPEYGNSQLGQQEKVLLEYVSANPTGPLHIGHGRWAAIGDTLARVLTKCGYQVAREFYINDVGLQIQNYLKSIAAAKNKEPIPENGYHGAYIQELAAQEIADPVAYMLDTQKKSLRAARVEFDNWFSEKTLVPTIPAILKFLQSKDLTYEKDGALWFRSTNYGDDKDRVLIKSDGEKTYFLSDIAYHKNKLERGFAQLINIWGADHHGYVSRMKAAVSAMANQPTSAPFDSAQGAQNAKLRVIIGQLVSLYRDGEPVRLSKRTGEIITLDEVIEEIGADAVRYFLARYSFDTPLDFDLSLAKKQSNDNPVYYVQYAHARICSILRQPEAGNITSSAAAGEQKLEPSERKLLLKLIRFPEELEVIAQNFTIHRLCAFAEELAALFHAFYQECRVISQDQQTTANRLTIVSATRTLLAIILELLGVSAPEKM